MSDKKHGRQPGGSSQPNGENERAHDAAKSVNLDVEQQRELHNRISGQTLTYKEIQEIAREVKSGQ
jgi:hypothetical protein